MGPILILFEVLESVISFKTFPRIHGWLICAGLTIEICFFPGFLDLVTAAHNAVFVFLFILVVEEVMNFRVP
jgi:hypothetical protein